MNDKRFIILNEIGRGVIVALSNKKKQQKAAKRTAKRKQVAKQLKQQQLVPKEVIMQRQLQHAARCPIHECYVPDNLASEGTGNITFSRKLDNGKIAVVSILLDIWETGVKDCVFAEISESNFMSMLSDMQSGDGNYLQQSPEHVLKLINGAIDFARKNGDVEPSASYDTVLPLFHDVDTNNCDVEFEYGQQQCLRSHRQGLVASMRDTYL